jgi:hypothetical protein
MSQQPIFPLCKPVDQTKIQFISRKLCTMYTVQYTVAINATCHNQERSGVLF